ncbi:Cytochrome bo(3) ubiquinol oxidase subunit 2 [Candidatus Hartigia pinicola]|nr:Cytochrome bo(3) ubiquinol oxidase subunit 2 [Candidatus Hartigia pinicola]
MKYVHCKKIIGIITIILTAVLLSGCDIALINPKGAVGIKQKELIFITVGLMLIIVIPVIFMAFIFPIKFCASNKSSIYRPNWDHSNTIELICWIIPIIMIIILGTITWKTTHELDPYKPLVNNQKPVTIEVISTNWKWIFIYPEEGIATVNEIAFPANVPVNFKITSNSVMNSFFIPSLGSQIYAMAGMQTKLHLMANEPGTYKGFSASYSGKGFSNMKFHAIATLDRQGFDQWVKKVKTSLKSIDTIQTFNEVARPSINEPVTYFSAVKPNLYEDIVLKFDHNNHNNHPL